MPVTFACADKKVEKLDSKLFKSFVHTIQKDLEQFPGKSLLRTGKESAAYYIYKNLLSNGAKVNFGVFGDDEDNKVPEPVLKFNRCNGFVFGAIEAYNQHHKFEISPDVLWLTIIAQYNYFQQRYAEETRELYVAHEGKKTLTVQADGNIMNFDSSLMISLFSDAIKDNIKDGNFVDWVVPNFTTTTPLDVFVSKAMMMSVLQKYFEFRFELCCGIPEYTIKGEKKDWEDIRKRLDYLDVLDAFLKTKGCKGYNGELGLWAPMLKEVISHFIEVFDGKIDLEFWNCICSHYGGGSGPSLTSGWISVFNCFDEDGKYIGNVFNDSWRRIKNSKWPIINDNDLVNAVTSVPVTIDDNGEKEYKCTLYAGIFKFETDNNYETVIPKSNYVLICDSVN